MIERMSLADPTLQLHLTVVAASGIVPETVLPPADPVVAPPGPPQSHLGPAVQPDVGPTQFFHPLARWVPAGMLAHRIALAEYLPRQPRRRRPVPVLKPGSDPFAAGTS